LDEVQSITANCKLPADVDAQLHLVLTQIIDGAEAMKAGKAADLGFAKVVAGMDDYGNHFDHPGWKGPAPH
jgi:hypothetical protein